MPEMAHDWLNKVFYSILFYSSSVRGMLHNALRNWIKESSETVSGIQRVTQSTLMPPVDFKASHQLLCCITPFVIG